MQSSDGDELVVQHVSEDKPATATVAKDQQVVVRFRIADPSNKPFSPQQAFVRFATSSGFEHIIVADPVRNKEQNYAAILVCHSVLHNSAHLPRKLSFRRELMR